MNLPFATQPVADNGAWSTVRAAGLLSATVFAVVATVLLCFDRYLLWANSWLEAIMRSSMMTLLLVPVIHLALARVRQRSHRDVAGQRSSPMPLRDGSSPHRQVRIAMHAVLLVAGAHTALQAWQADQWHALHAGDAEVGALAGAQRMLSQRIARLANLISAGGADSPQHVRELRTTLDRAGSDAASLEQRLRKEDVLAADHPSALREALVDWEQTRQSLWLRAHALLHLLDSGATGELEASVSQVEAAADPALHAAQRLVEQVGASARERDRNTVRASEAWAAFTILLLFLLAIAAIEPTVRSVRSQYLRLAAQAHELQRLALVSERTTNAVMITDSMQRILWVNEAFTRITGHALGEALGQRPTHLLQTDRVDAPTTERILAATEVGQGIRTQVPGKQQDGSDLWFDLDIQPLRDEGGVLTGFVCMASDITQRRQGQVELRIAAIAFDSLEAIAITDANQVILKVNPAFERITGYSADEAIGQVTGKLLKSGRQDATFYAAMWQALKQDKHWQGEVWNRRKSGEVYAEWLSITAVMDDEDKVANYVAVFSDVTQKKLADETIHHLAFYDPLTALPNRRLLRDRLEQAMATSERQLRQAAVLFIDLDRFKDLNDTKGHEVGDLLLIEVARRLHSSVRASDTVARQGGDEFVVILAGLTAQAEPAAVQAEMIAEKIRAAISQPFQLKDHEYQGTSSIGICLFQGNDTTADELLKRADTAMYQAKAAGRNAIRFFDPATHAVMESRIALEADLRHAQSRSQLQLHYQMQVDRSGRVLGAEVLLRWLHPNRGLVPPAQFIPLAEESDLMLSIGHWVLQTACEQLQAWEGESCVSQLHLAVNVSARQFRQPDFVEQVRAVLDRTGVDPRKLKLELTESLVVHNVTDTIAKMRAIKDLGVRFSIDDFGTGHSSLAYLTQLPLDQLKIDQSFVRNMSLSRTDAVVVQTIIAMAKSLELEVIAEGVETEQQRSFLERCGCLNYQGYLFGRPVPLTAFLEATRMRQVQLVATGISDSSIVANAWADRSRLALAPMAQQ